MYLPALSAWGADTSRLSPDYFQEESIPIWKGSTIRNAHVGKTT